MKRTFAETTDCGKCQLCCRWMSKSDGAEVQGVEDAGREANDDTYTVCRTVRCQRMLKPNTPFSGERSVGLFRAMDGHSACK